MASYKRRTIARLYKWTVWSKTMLPLSVFSLLTFSGCQTLPSIPKTAPLPIEAVVKKTVPVSNVSTSVIKDSDYADDYINDDANKTEDYSDTPYVIPKLEQAPDIIAPTGTPTARPLLPTAPSHNELLERARQHSQQQSRATHPDNSQLPAVQNLMQVGIRQLKSGELSAAESSFTRAQRLAPKSSAVYFYLAHVALKKNQPRKAEAMARRGLSVTQDISQRRALWQLILRSGQQQNNTRVIKEAEQALR